MRFIDISRHYPTGVCVITLPLNITNGPLGLTMGSLTFISFEPSIISFSLGQARFVHPYFEKSQHFGIHLLRRDQENISRFFSRPFFKDGQEEAQDWKDIHYDIKGNNLPIMRDCNLSFEVELLKKEPIGDHTVFYCSYLNAFSAESFDFPLLYVKSNYATLK